MEDHAVRTDEETENNTDTIVTDLEKNENKDETLPTEDDTLNESVHEEETIEVYADKGPSKPETVEDERMTENEEGTLLDKPVETPAAHIQKEENQPEVKEVLEHPTESDLEKKEDENNALLVDKNKDENNVTFKQSLENRDVEKVKHEEEKLYVLEKKPEERSDTELRVKVSAEKSSSIKAIEKSVKTQRVEEKPHVRMEDEPKQKWKKEVQEKPPTQIDQVKPKEVFHAQCSKNVVA